MRPRVLHSIVVQTCLLLPMGLVLFAGCVAKDTHLKTLGELDAAKQHSAEQALELEHMKAQLQAQADHLKQQLAALQQSLDEEAAQRKTAEETAAAIAREREQLETRSRTLEARLADLEAEKSRLGQDLNLVRTDIATLQKKLEDETSQVSSLEQDKQALAQKTAAAQQAITVLQQRAAQLEADSARVTQEREQLRQQHNHLAASLARERERLKAEEAEKARLAQEQAQLAASLEQERQRLKAEEVEKARLEQERAAKEAEIARLTRTQEELSRSLQDEIAKGNITIQQVRDQLTINMVDKVLFDSGQAQVKPAGMKVLKQVSDVLNKITDKQIRIEGHTDNVPISVKLQDKFKSNWELSTARATTVVRYLIEQGGVDRQYLSAVGYADTHPVGPNDTDEGRSANRRIEIVLHPKDLSAISGQLSSAAIGER